MAQRQQTTAADPDRPARTRLTKARKPWPITPLGQLEWLTDQLEKPTVPAVVIYPEMDNRVGGPPLSLAYVRAPLILTDTPSETIDRTWRYVIEAARRDKGDWNLFALGLAMPGLRESAFRLAPAPPDKKTPPIPLYKIKKVHQDLAAQFVIRLHQMDIDAPKIFRRLLDQCVKAIQTGWRYDTQERKRLISLADWESDLNASGRDNSARPAIDDRPGHPFIALARLVRRTADQPPGRRLTQEDAALLAYTYIEGYTVEQAATILGLSEPTARMRNHRARKLVARLLHHQPK